MVLSSFLHHRSHRSAATKMRLASDNMPLWPQVNELWNFPNGMMLPSYTQSMLFVVTIALLIVSKTYAKALHPHCTCERSFGSRTRFLSTDEPGKHSDQRCPQESYRGRPPVQCPKLSSARRRHPSLNARMSPLRDTIIESESEGTDSAAETIVPAHVPARRQQIRQLRRSCSQSEFFEANESIDADGEIFRSILRSQSELDREGVSSMWKRLSPRKQRNCRTLMRHENLCHAFSALSPFVGLWTDLKLGNLHKLLATHADEVSPLDESG